MIQTGLKINSSSEIDNLTYTYNSNSNKLLKVVDTVTAENKLRDFYDGTSGSGNDYAYDANGNLISDANKNISSITYNYLNLPSLITVTGKGTIIYTYDATGNKLKKVTVDNTIVPSKTTTTLYLGGAVYENDQLQFIAHEEGRIRPVRDVNNNITGFAYDYFLKDHLGNVRMVLTEETKSDQYPPASMETAQATTEEALCANLPQTRVSKPSGYPTDNYTNPNNNVAKTNGNGNKIGPSIILKVMAGDKFNLRVSSWYKKNGATPQSPNSIATDLVTGLINSLTGTGGPVHGAITSAQLTSSGVIPISTTNFLNNSQPAPGTTKPKAYINWVLLDEQFKFVQSSSSAEQVGNDQEFKVHVKNDMSLAKSGYLYVFVSNETPNIDVYFDNLQITHTRGAILEETHYYPFGLTMTGISSKALQFGGAENKYKYNGKEEQRMEFSDGSGLEWLDYGARMYDNEIGRWNTQDALSENTYGRTPYNYGLNNPIVNIDVKGYFSIRIHRDITASVLQAFGYNNTTRDLVGHYASVYADNPTGFTGALIRGFENNLRWSGVDYSATVQSQNTANVENSTWHSMRADGENVTNEFAKARGQEFGWNKIFDASSEIKNAGGIGKLKKNSKGVQALGQGVHALQDALAHRGTDMEHHDVWRDMMPGAKLYAELRTVTQGAIMVTEIMSGSSKNLKDGMSINVDGMTRAQFTKFLTQLIDVMNKTEGINKVTLKNKPDR